MPFKNVEERKEYNRRYHTPEYCKGYRKRCGDARRAYEMAWRKSNPERRLLSNAKQRTRIHGLPQCDLELTDIFIPRLCPILGIPLGSMAGGRGQVDDSPSLDRINPLLGYVKGNVAVISMRANVIKNCGTAEEHRKIADWIEGH